MALTRTEIQKRYDSVHCTGFYLKLNKENDSDIISKLSQCESKQGYIKQLIREDIAHTKSDIAPKQAEKTTLKKNMSIDKLYVWLQEYANENYDGSIYDVINALSSKLMGYEIDE